MFRAKCYLKGASPLSFGRRYEDERPKDVDPWEHEVKTWRERVHTNSDNECIIPALMLKGALVSVAKLLGDKIKGSSGQKYWKPLKAGVIAENDIPLGIKKDELEYEDVYVTQRGQQIRRRFPIIREWEGWITFTVVPDSIVTQKKFAEYLNLAGQMAGIGRYRPPNGGTYGKFTVEKIEYEKIKS